MSTFGSQAVAIGDLDKDGVVDLAITAFVFNNESSMYVEENDCVED